MRIVKATSVESVVTDADDDDYIMRYLLDHVKYQPPEEYTEGKRCNFCGETDDWEWTGVVAAKGEGDGALHSVKKIGKVLLCMQCLVNGGWIGNDAVQRRQRARRGSVQRDSGDPSGAPTRNRLDTLLHRRQGGA